MSGVVFCFSGTGNSLYVARKIAEGVDSELALINRKLILSEVSGSSHVHNRDSETLGIVFPVYHQGLPNIIREFVECYDFIGINYVYGVITYGDKPTLALKYLKELLKKKGVELNHGFGVRMPYNFVRPTKFGRGFYDSFRLAAPSDEKQLEMFEKADHEIGRIVDTIQCKKEGKPITSDVLIESLVDILHLRALMQKPMWLKAMNYDGIKPKTFAEAIKVMDSTFRVNNRCNSCGLCQQLCPVNNIDYIDGQPTFKHQCELCFRCVGYCQQQAIMPSDDTTQKPYHHREINAKDFLQ